MSSRALGPTQPPVQPVLGLSRGKERPGRDADTLPPSSAVVHKRVELYLYSPYGSCMCTANGTIILSIWQRQVCFLCVHRLSSNTCNIYSLQLLCGAQPETTSLRESVKWKRAWIQLDNRLKLIEIYKLLQLSQTFNDWALIVANTLSSTQ
jgi:hypothetical protein